MTTKMTPPAGSDLSSQPLDSSDASSAPDTGRRDDDVTTRIAYDADARDYACYATLDGVEELIGFAGSHSEAAGVCREYRFNHYLDRHTPERAAQIALEAEPLALYARPAEPTICSAPSDGPCICGVVIKSLTICDNCPAPATTTIGLLQLCDACERAAAARLLAAAYGLVCLSCGDPVAQEGLCEACQEAGEPWPVVRAIDSGIAASGLIPVLTLHAWATTDRPSFRAALAALNAAQLEWQAAVYSAYLALRTGKTVTNEATLAHFNRNVAIHEALQMPEPAGLAACPCCGGPHNLAHCREFAAEWRRQDAAERPSVPGPIRRLYASLAALPIAPKQDSDKAERERLLYQAGRLSTALWEAQQVALFHDLPERQRGIYDGPAWKLYLRLSHARQRAAARWERRLEAGQAI